MKKTKSLRRQLNLMFSVIVIFQTIIILCSLIFSNVFDMLDFESVRTFTNITEATAESYNNYNRNIMAFISKEDDNLSRKIEKIATQRGVAINDIYSNDNLYREMMLEISNELICVLNESKVTGAFVILDNTTSLDNNTAHTSVYIRDNVPEKNSTGDLQLNVGPIFIAQNFQFPTSSNWTPDFVKPINEKDFDYYNKPLYAANTLNINDILQSGYWTPPLDILNDGANVICYSVPLFDSKGDG